MRDSSRGIQEFEYTSPAQQVIFGAGTLDQLGTFVERFHWQRLMLCTSGSYQRNGRIARLEVALGQRVVATFDRVQSHVPDFQVTEALTLGQQNDIDAIIGLGGGSPIGMAKAVSLALEDMRADQTDRAGTPIDQSRIPVIAIPSTYAGSEMTPVYGVTHHSDGMARKMTVNNPKVAPRLVLYDPQLTIDLPSELTASSGINALAHCVEALYSITRNPLSTAAAMEGARYIAHALPRCYAAGDDLEARTEMLMGSHLAGVALASVVMGLHHGLCHVLGGTAGVPHGIANAIILPFAMQYNADYCAHELGRFAQAVGITGDARDGAEQAQQAIQWVHELVRQMNLPYRLRETGVEKTELPHLAQLAAQSRTVQNNPKPASVADVTAILQAAW